MSKLRDRAEHRLLKAAAAYIRAAGGHAVVIGGIETQEWPDERPGKYRLAIHFAGRKPEKEYLNGPAGDLTAKPEGTLGAEE